MLVTPDPVNFHTGRKYRTVSFLVKTGTEIHIHGSIRNSFSGNHNRNTIDLPDQLLFRPFQ